MIWHEIVAAVLAGGLAGQLAATFLGYRYASRREFANWLRDERYRAFSELLMCVSPFATQKEFDAWPDEIRKLSQRVYLLYPGGRPPQQVDDAVQHLFMLTLNRKLGKVDDLGKWRDEMRSENRALRAGLADVIHV